MKTDPIKKYVEVNRAAFDQLEPPADVLQKIKSRLQSRELVEKKSIPLFNKKIWLAAASILIVMSTFYLFDRKNSVSKVAIENNEESDLTANTVSKQNKDGQALAAVNPVIENRAAVNEDVTAKLRMDASSAVRDVHLKPAQKEIIPEAINSSDDLYARLNDGNSSSARLAAILEMERVGQMHKNEMNVLARILNTDENSNVRLAALNVIGQYADKAFASSILVQSLARQDDPIVQLELIELLSDQKDSKIDARLLTLAGDPKTFPAVKDEAYAVLLRNNKI